MAAQSRFHRAAREIESDEDRFHANSSGRSRVDHNLLGFETAFWALFQSQGLDDRQPESVDADIAVIIGAR